MDELPTENEKQFHGWRLIAVIMSVIVVLALISAAVDWMVVG
jgi:flagellar biogenesis protein FliO